MYTYICFSYIFNTLYITSMYKIRFYPFVLSKTQEGSVKHWAFTWPWGGHASKACPAHTPSKDPRAQATLTPLGGLWVEGTSPEAHNHVPGPDVQTQELSPSEPSPGNLTGRRGWTGLASSGAEGTKGREVDMGQDEPMCADTVRGRRSRQAKEGQEAAWPREDTNGHIWKSTCPLVLVFRKIEMVETEEERMPGLERRKGRVPKHQGKAGMSRCWPIRGVMQSPLTLL